VYVSNFSSNTVTVVDGRLNTVVETVPVGVVPDGVASDPFTRRTYVTNSITSDVSVIVEE
jgi:YVTN family beta-propeller protein